MIVIREYATNELVDASVCIAMDVLVIITSKLAGITMIVLIATTNVTSYIAGVGACASPRAAPVGVITIAAVIVVVTSGATTKESVSPDAVTAAVADLAEVDETAAKVTNATAEEDAFPNKQEHADLKGYSVGRSSFFSYPLPCLLDRCLLVLVIALALLSAVLPAVVRKKKWCLDCSV